MTSVRENMKKFILIAILGFVFSYFFVLSRDAGAAEEKLTLSVTPPLFQLNIGPGESWASSVKTINTNPYQLTLYASVINFEPQGETGQGKLTPIVEEDPGASGNSLAHWIEISKDPIIVPRETSVEIPFSVRIPQNAPPGGHYAAILVGTRPITDPNEGSNIQVSSLVSSLLFVRVRGEIIEEGNIREFLTDKTFYQEPDVVFTLRFENKGNVHLQPQGDITIYNMWGKERGKISVNQKTAFGNVLPQSIRKFSYEWKGDENFFEAGRYKAITTLTFGKEARQNVSRTTYFWVVPLKPTLAILGSFMLFSAFVVLAIRFYIKKSIAVVRREYGLLPGSTRPVADTVIANSSYEQGVKNPGVPQNHSVHGSPPPNGGGAQKVILANQNFQRSAVDVLGGHPLIELKRTNLKGWGILIKRVSDIIGAILLLPFLLPLFLVVGFLIKWDSKGPVFVKLKRVSGGKEFELFKFRSMIDGADRYKSYFIPENERYDGPLFKLKNDPRVTRIGRLIRSKRIDELPQIFNVLKGDTSMVGPRPHEPAEVAKYEF